MRMYTLRLAGIAGLMLLTGLVMGGCECRATATDDTRPVRVEEERKIKVKAPFTDVEVKVPKKDHDHHD